MNLNFTLIIQIVSFLALLGLLTRYFYKPFMEYLDKRSQEVKGMMEEAQRNREASQKELGKAQDELKITKEQVLQMKNTVAREADEHRRHTIEDAKKEAVSILARAKLEIQKEADEAKKNLTKDISSLSIDIAKKIIDREIKESDYKKLIEASIKELADG